jgi:quercetin dioxygenase-like cupin family protein
VQVQFLRPTGKYVAFEVPVTHYCNPGSTTACVNEQYLFCTDRFCVEAVTLGPGAISTQHTHDGDHVVIATDDFQWRDEVVGKEGVDRRFKPGDVMYEKAGITHRLINNGNTTARLVMVQFK